MTVTPGAGAVDPGSSEPGTRPGEGGPDLDVAALRARLRDLQAARAELPPHSAQGWRADLDAQIDTVRRRLARVDRHRDPG